MAGDDPTTTAPEETTTITQRTTTTPTTAFDQGEATVVAVDADGQLVVLDAGSGEVDRVLRRVGTLTFGPTRFRETCESAQVLTAGSDADEILGHLYEFGVIGFARRGGAGRGGTDEYWRYRDPEVTFDAGAPYFRVHPGLKENLDLKEERKE